VSDSGFGSPINHYVGSNDNDQPWVRTGPSNHVSVAFNDLGQFGSGNGKTSSVNVSIDGGAHYTTVDARPHRGQRARRGAGRRRGAACGQRQPGLRGFRPLDRYGRERRQRPALYVRPRHVRSDNAGGDGFNVIGSGGNGVTAANHTAVFVKAQNT